MINEILLYTGSAIITLWGIAHIMAMRPVVNGFGEISIDNRRVILMEWIAEGITFCFIGVLVIYLTVVHGSGDTTAIGVYRFSAGALVVMAVLSAFTGARTQVLPMKMCPYVKTTVAVLFVLGSIL